LKLIELSGALRGRQGKLVLKVGRRGLIVLVLKSIAEVLQPVSRALPLPSKSLFRLVNIHTEGVRRSDVSDKIAASVRWRYVRRAFVIA
jgi:hypothetical protein